LANFGVEPSRRRRLEKKRESRDYKITSKRKKERKGRATRERVEEIRRREVA